MFFQPNLGQTCGALKDAIGASDDVSAALMHTVLDLVAPRCATPDRAARITRINALIEAEAWSDAALAIAALDRAHAVRRIVRDDGEWYCTIGSQWPVPDWLDHNTWYSHPVLPLAIMGAVVDALSQNESAAPAATWRQLPGREHGDAIASFGCDNYC